jgi:hypothetical protein
MLTLASAVAVVGVVGGVAASCWWWLDTWK